MTLDNTPSFGDCGNFCDICSGDGCMSTCGPFQYINERFACEDCHHSCTAGCTSGESCMATACAESCASCSSFSFCTSCWPGAVLSTGGECTCATDFLADPLHCAMTCLDHNCEICAQGGRCLQCRDGFNLLEDGACQACKFLSTCNRYLKHA
jgi:hypothetical protein